MANVVTRELYRPESGTGQTPVEYDWVLMFQTLRKLELMLLTNNNDPFKPRFTDTEMLAELRKVWPKLKCE